MKNNILFSIILIFIFVYEVKSSAPLTELAIGSRSYAMGQTTSLSRTDLLGSINYPANLAQLNNIISSIYYSSPYEDTKNMRIGIAVPLKDHGTIGFNYFRFILDGIIWRNALGRSEGTASYIQNEFTLSYGLYFTKNILFGLNAKWIQDEFTNVKDNNPMQKNASLDFAIGYLPKLNHTFLKDLGFGFIMKNFIQENSIEGHIPIEYRLIAENRFSHNKSTFHLAINYLWLEDFLEEYQAQFHVGLEYGYDYIKFRTGFNEDRYSFGIGVNIQFITLDYGYGRSWDQIYYNPDQHNFTLSIIL